MDPIWKLAGAVIIALGLLVWSCTPPRAQMACGPYNKVTEALTSKYGEHRRMYGLLTNRPGLRLEIWASAKGGWTVITVDTKGGACLRFVGEDMEFLPAPPPGDPA